MLAAVAQMPDTQLVDGLDALVGSGLAWPRGKLTDTTYAFKHALVQDAVCDQLVRRRRAEIHARIVAAAESDASLGVTEPGLLVITALRQACLPRPPACPGLPAGVLPNARRFGRRYASSEDFELSGNLAIS